MMREMESGDLALFRSVNAALAFAFNFTHGQYKPSAMASMMGGPRKQGRGLGGLDGAGQAGIIRLEVERVAPAARAQILVARFAVRSVPCSCRHECCSGHRPNQEWLLAIAELASLVREEALERCVVNFKLRHDIVRRYFGEKKSLVDAARSAGVDRDTASAHAGKIIAFLKSEEQHARYEIEGRLKVAGIVE